MIVSIIFNQIRDLTKQYYLKDRQALACVHKHCIFCFRQTHVIDIKQTEYSSYAIVSCLMQKIEKSLERTYNARRTNVLA